MNIIDINYFQGLYTIGSRSSIETTEYVESLINVFQPEYLTKVMGKSLYSFYKANSIDPVFLDINNILKDRFNSPLVAYIYIKYLDEENVGRSTEIGTIKGKAGNSREITSYMKHLLAWNRMVSKNQTLYQYIKDNDNLKPYFRSIEIDRDIFFKKNQFGL